MKILIVDDSATNRKLLRIRLEAEGLEILDASLIQTFFEPAHENSDC